MRKKANYDKKVRLTRILLSDYLVLKRVSQVAGVSMAEALHQLIEHQAQLPMIDMAVKPMPVTTARSMPVTTARARSTPVSISFSREVNHVNGHGKTD